LALRGTHYYLSYTMLIKESAEWANTRSYVDRESLFSADEGKVGCERNKPPKTLKSQLLVCCEAEEKHLRNDKRPRGLFKRPRRTAGVLRIRFIFS
jgi:hypothetical protein